MSREHGTRVRYVLGPDEGGTPGKGCRCPVCGKANRADANHRTRLIAYGQWQPYVDAEPAREHARMLAAYGIGWRRAAALAGISTGAMSKLLYGGPAGRPPTRRIRPETEAAILAVRPSLDLLADAAPVDATGTRRRVQALIATGWSQSKIAARIGMTPANFGDLLHNRPQVTAATARAVRAVYDELWNQAPAQAAHRDKIAASRSRNYARARGWALPAAWDDDRIEDPDAEPAEGWQRHGQRRSGAETAAEARELAGFGLTRAQAAERLGVSVAAIEKALERYPEAGEAA